MCFILFTGFISPSEFVFYSLIKGEKEYRNWQFSNLNKIACFSLTNMKFSHLVELITVNKPTDEIYLEISHNFSYSTGCPNKYATYFTKHETIALCLIAKILFDSKAYA